MITHFILYYISYFTTIPLINTNAILISFQCECPRFSRNFWIFEINWIIIIRSQLN